MIQSFEELRNKLQQNGKCRKIAAVCVYDEATKSALNQCEQLGLAEIIYVNDDIPEEAANKAVAMVRNGEADVLMKGLIGTDQLLRAVLNKEHGLLPEGRILTHLTLAEIPTYHKMLFFSDAAVIP